jgi:imidazolonepropionase-like amidohydrolase
MAPPAFRAAIRAGIDTIEHASLIDAEGIRLAREHGTWLVMDIYNTEYTQAHGRENGILEDNLRKDREIAQLQRDNFRAAHAAGVHMAFGTDAGVMPHGSAGGQFRYMVEYGMTPMEAIQAATTNAAQALGRERDVGAIAAGRYGDLIAVDGDPLANVASSRASTSSSRAANWSATGARRGNQIGEEHIPLPLILSRDWACASIWAFRQAQCLLSMSGSVFFPAHPE